MKLTRDISKNRPQWGIEVSSYWRHCLPCYSRNIYESFVCVLRLCDWNINRIHSEDWKYRFINRLYYQIDQMQHFVLLLFFSNLFHSIIYKCCIDLYWLSSRFTLNESNWPKILDKSYEIPILFLLTQKYIVINLKQNIARISFRHSFSLGIAVRWYSSFNILRSKAIKFNFVTIFVSCFNKSEFVLEI